MKYIKVNSGPHKELLFIGHDDAEAYDKQAGEVGACVNTADLSDVYRSLLPDAHENAFTDILLKNSAGVKKAVDTDATAKAQALADKTAAAKGKTSEKVTDVLESYIKFANRVRGTVSVEEWKSLDDAVHAAAKTMPCDSSPSARTKGPSKNALAKADDILADSIDNRETRITKLLTVVEGFELERGDDNVPDKTSLARLIDERFKAVEV